MFFLIAIKCQSFLGYAAIVKVNEFHFLIKLCSKYKTKQNFDCENLLYLCCIFYCIKYAFRPIENETF